MNTEIENWLLAQKAWIPAAIIYARFNIDQRKLRRARGKPGILSVCAISDTALGYRHIANATDAEFDRCHTSDRKAAVSALVTLRQQRAFRRSIGSPKQGEFSL